MTLKDRVLAAARADDIPAGAAGLWTVTKVDHKVFAVNREMKNGNRDRGRWIPIPPATYTYLHRYTEATLHERGELVMHDRPDELATHLEFMLRARGRVLVTGLGLGCVTRGLLANPAVHSITVVERVAPHMPDDRMAIAFDDALRFCERTRTMYDCAWHDLWSDPDANEEHLAINHQRMMLALRGRVRYQGAWAFPRYVDRLFRNNEGR